MSVRSRPRQTLAALGFATLLITSAAARGDESERRVDGELAYSCDGDICVIHVDGSGWAKLTHDKWIDSYPAWSPDGSSIAFTGNLGKTVIYVMNADGTRRRRLTPRGGDEALAAWSPDRRTIAFDDNESGSIYLADLDRTMRRRLTT